MVALSTQHASDDIDDIIIRAEKADVSTLSEFGSNTQWSRWHRRFAVDTAPRTFGRQLLFHDPSVRALRLIEL
jgi:hypothetical protein